jgi:RecB family exonuclease
MYKHHYIDRVRPIGKGSALFFGGAMDEALNHLLETKNFTKMKKNTILDSSKYAFVTEWEKCIDNPDIEYFKSDIEFSLITELAVEDLIELDPEVTDHFEFLEECYAILKKKDKLSEEDQKLYNRIAWFSLLEKGKLLVEAYYNDILPQVHTVFDIQKKIELPDGKGNTIIGYIDAIVSFIDAPDRKVVLDNKTSSSTYKSDSVSLSTQLATYCEAEEIDYGAYGVVEKKIRKREPRTRTNLIIDEIPEKLLDETFQMYDNVLEGIQNEEFDKNYESGCYFYGKPCPYFRYCKSNGKKMDGLEKL